MNIIRFISLVISGLVNGDNLELLQVIVHTRHGARAPMYDLLDQQTWWIYNYGIEELTTVGHRQHYLLGSALKKKYKDFLPRYFQEKYIEVHATESQRAVRSAESFMFGLYPEAPDAKDIELEHLEFSLPPGYMDDDLYEQVKNLRKQKIPYSYQTIPLIAPFQNTDTLLSPENVCPKVKQLRKEALESQQYKDFESSLWESGFYQRFVEALKDELIKHNLNIDTSVPNSDLNMTLVGKFYDSIVCNLFENRPLPKDLTYSINREILFVYDVQNLWYNFPTSETVKLMASMNANNMLSAMQNTLTGHGKKFILYSGHDGDVNTMMQFLGLITPTFDFKTHEDPATQGQHTNAPFASSIIFELYRSQQTNEEFVQISFNGQVQNLQFCQNPQLCTYNEFSSYILQNTFNEKDWMVHCITSSLVEVQIDQ